MKSFTRIVMLGLLLAGCPSDGESGKKGAGDVVQAPTDTAEPTDVEAPTDTGEPTDPGEPSDPGLPSDPGPTDDPGGAACDEAAAATLCCCDYDAVTQLICEAGEWTCPNGYGLFSGNECSWECGGPCSLPCQDEDVTEPPADLVEPTEVVEPDVMEHADLALTFGQSGGFAGWTTTAELLVDGAFTTSSSGPAAGGCTQPAQEAWLVTLDQLAQSVDWPAVVATYKPKDNPLCCCDQFVYSLSVTYDGASYATDWCDQSASDGGMPKPLLDFVVGLQGVIQSAIEACP